jgi:acetyl esterase/lipase
MLPNPILNRILRKKVLEQFAEYDDLLVMRDHFIEEDRKFSFLERFHRMQREDVVINDVPSQWIKVKRSREDHVLLYLHGGAFCLKTPSLHGQMLARICNRIGFTGLMPDYRLTPENTFPEPLDDCMTAYKWLLDEGYDPAKIVIGGDSAGGSLTMALLMEIKDNDLPMPKCSFLLSPALRLSPEDDTPASDSRIENADSDVILPTPVVRKFQNALMPSRDFSHPIFNILNADFAGLPPLHFQAGTTEILRDDSVLAAKRSEDAGIETELILWPDHPHVFMIFPFAQNAIRSVRMIANFINTYID